MNVEKLREVGQKLGYKGEELNEFVEEQLAYQLEEECLEAEEREAQRLHEEAQRLHEERMKQLEQKLRDLEAREQLQDQEGIEQSHLEDVMEEIPEKGIRYPLDDDAAEEDSLKINEDIVVEGSCGDNCEMDPGTKVATLVQDRAKGLAKVPNEQQTGSGRTDGDFLTSNPDGANAGVWVNTTANSTKGEWLGTVGHNPWGARGQPQDQEKIEQSNVKRDEQEKGAEEESSKVEQVFMGLGAMEQPQNQDGIGQSHMEGYPINEKQQSGVEECSGRPMWAESEDTLADKSQKSASAIQVLGLAKEIQAGNDKVPMMEIDIEGQKAMALKNLARAIMGKFQVIFSDKPGICKLVKHRKQLTSDVPVQSWPYTIPYTVKQELVRRLGRANSKTI